MNIVICVQTGGLIQTGGLYFCCNVLCVSGLFCIAKT